MYFFLDPVYSANSNPIFDRQPESVKVQNVLQDAQAATHIVQVPDDAMAAACIPKGAWVEVEPSAVLNNQQIVLARVGKVQLVRRFIRNSSGCRLMPADERFPPLPILPESDIEILGVVRRIQIDLPK